MFNQYNIQEPIHLASNNSSKFYFIQLGAYSSYDSMITNTNKLESYIYLQNDNLYYVFGCITKNKNNLDKIEGYFKDNGYTTYRKEFNLSKESLEEEINKIDLILNETNDQSSIKKLCIKGLELYKEG